MLTRTISALAAVGLTFVTLVLATPLHAAESDVQTVLVKVADLDLTTDRGAATLSRRVRAAARTICGTVPALDLDLQRQVAECQEEVIANAQADVDMALANARPRQNLARRAR